MSKVSKTISMFLTKNGSKILIGASIVTMTSAIVMGIKSHTKYEILMAEAEDGAMLDIDGEMVKITKDLVDLRIEGEEGYSVGMDGGVAVAISTELTQELVDEGFAREIISKVQQMRKQQNFEMMDNVTISIACDDEVAAAAEKHKEYIMTETLATDLNVAQGEGDVKINGHKTGIEVERV
jgi:isoleucyl-tRNA synthetase